MGDLAQFYIAKRIAFLFLQSAPIKIVPLDFQLLFSYTHFEILYVL